MKIIKSVIKKTLEETGLKKIIIEHLWVVSPRMTLYLKCFLFYQPMKHITVPSLSPIPGSILV